MTVGRTDDGFASGCREGGPVAARSVARARNPKVVSGEGRGSRWLAAIPVEPHGIHGVRAFTMHMGGGFEHVLDRSEGSLFQVSSLRTKSTSCANDSSAGDDSRGPTYQRGGMRRDIAVSRRRWENRSGRARAP